MEETQNKEHKGFIQFVKVHKIISVILGPLLLFIIVFFSFVDYSEHPSFYKSCHIMVPYYNAWKASAHNFVPCVKCHYPPTNSIKTAVWHKIQNFSMVVRLFHKDLRSKTLCRYTRCKLYAHRLPLHKITCW